MEKKLFLMLSSLFLSFMLLGCGMNQDQEPPPEDQQNGQLEDTGENMDEIEEDLEAPFEDPDNDGIDENDPNPED